MPGPGGRRGPGGPGGRGPGGMGGPRRPGGMGGPPRGRRPGPPPPPPGHGWGGGYRRGCCLPGCLMYVLGAGGMIALLVMGIAALI